MPRLKENEIPSYRLHRQSGQAIVTLNGKDVLLGKHGSAASKAEYRRLSAEWLSTRGAAPSVTGDDLTISELILAYWRYAKGHFRKADGSPTSGLHVIHIALKPVRELYGSTAAANFSPRCLEAVMHDMVKLGWVRASINKHASTIRRMFKWAVKYDLVSPAVYHKLQCVEGLQRGRCKAVESEPVRPVPEACIDAVLPHVSKQIAGMIQLQLLTGARPGEICAMRGCDLDTTGRLWTYKPSSHKTEYHGHHRVIYLGPGAIEVVRPFLKTDTRAYLFSPIDSETDRRELQHAERKTPLSCGNQPRRRRRRQLFKDHFDVEVYRRAIARACDEAFPPPAHLARQRVPANGRKKNATRWETLQEYRARLGNKARAELQAWRDDHRWHPHQLRHNAGTRLRKEYGLEAAQVILGHKTLTVTQIYAEKNVEAAQRIMGEVG